MKYPIIIHKDLDSDYGVTVPDLPGCFTAGSSIENTIHMAQEAIECHVEGLLIDHEQIPSSTPIEVHQKNTEYDSGIWAIVEVDLNKLSIKSRNVRITVPESLLNSIDQYAKENGGTRSQLMTQAVSEYLMEHI